MGAADSMCPMTPEEIARGFLVGSEGTIAPAVDRTIAPRDALERVILPALRSGPCGVAFSGGRDSAVVLAVATHVARREGLPEPIALTRVFPQLEEADERDWQELVIRRLGLADWQRLEFTDELEVIGPYAARHLRQHGVVWPAAMATTVPLLEAIPGGNLLDGEGGDDVLGSEFHRIGWTSHLLRTPRAIGKRSLRAAAADLAPAPLRYRHLHARRDREPFGWLRPQVRADFIADLVRDQVEQPLSFAAAVRALPQRRILRVGERNRAVLARGYGVERVSPLLHPEFVHAMARDGGVFGRGERATVIRYLAGDLLPEGLITRRSKARFNRAYIGRLARDFAQRWDGTGVDPDLVDPDGLRATWLDETPHFMSALLLQQAWLASSASRTRLG